VPYTHVCGILLIHGRIGSEVESSHKVADVLRTNLKLTYAVSDMQAFT
jgi:hypothetical protein